MFHCNLYIDIDPKTDQLIARDKEGQVHSTEDLIEMMKERVRIEGSYSIQLPWDN